MSAWAKIWITIIKKIAPVSNSECIYHHVDDDGCPLAQLAVCPDQPTNCLAKVPKDPEDP